MSKRFPTTVYHPSVAYTMEYLDPERTVANPFWPFILQAVTWGLPISKYENGDGTYGGQIVGITDYNLFTTELVAALASGGFGTKNYPAYVKLPEADLADEVPDHLPNKDIVDDDGNVTGTKTWAEWASNPRIEGGNAYIGLGRTTSEVIVPLITAGFTVLSHPAALADLAQFETEEV